jgi:hypothetical protein
MTTGRLIGISQESCENYSVNCEKPKTDPLFAAAIS